MDPIEKIMKDTAVEAQTLQQQLAAGERKLIFLRGKIAAFEEVIAALTAQADEAGMPVGNPDPKIVPIKQE